MMLPGIESSFCVAEHVVARPPDLGPPPDLAAAVDPAGPSPAGAAALVVPPLAPRKPALSRVAATIIKQTKSLYSLRWSPQADPPAPPLLVG
jgi:hypothetical protein